MSDQNGWPITGLTYFTGSFSAFLAINDRNSFTKKIENSHCRSHRLSGELWFQSGH